MMQKKDSGQSVACEVALLRALDNLTRFNLELLSLI